MRTMEEAGKNSKVCRSKYRSVFQEASPDGRGFRPYSTASWLLPARGPAAASVYRLMSAY